MKIVNETAEFNAIINGDKPVFVEFYADWCSDCRNIEPALDELAPQYASEMELIKVNIEENKPLAEQYGVRGIPLMLFINGGQVVSQIKGVHAKSALKAKLDELVALKI